MKKQHFRKLLNKELVIMIRRSHRRALAGPRERTLQAPRAPRLQTAGFLALSIATIGMPNTPPDELPSCDMIKQWRIPSELSFCMVPGCFMSTTGSAISEPCASLWYVCLCCSSPCWLGYWALHSVHLHNIETREWAIHIDRSTGTLIQ